MGLVGTVLSRVYRRMPWFIHYLTLLLPLAMSMLDMVDSGKRLPFYWNASNPIFHSDNQKLLVNLGDRLNIICPNYTSYVNESDMEYYAIYMVSKSEYDECVIYDPDNAIRLIRCLKSNSTTLFTLHVRRFQPFPFVPDFEAGKSYYIVTTSEGPYSGIANQWGGACKHRGMRLQLEVCCSSTTTASDDNSPKYTVGKRTTLPMSYTKRISTTTRRITTTIRPWTTTRRSTTTTRTTTRKQPSSFDTEVVAPDHKHNPDIGNKNSEISATGPKNMGLINSSAFPRYSWTLLFVLIHVCRWALLSR